MRPAAGMPPSTTCGTAGLLDQALAAAAGPLAVDVAVHEELRRDDVQLLADVLADARHGAAALGFGQLVSAGSW
jgi:hypothetical protein